MPHFSDHHGQPLAVILTGTVVILAIALIWLAWSGGQHAIRGIKLPLRDAAPTLPHLPQGPKLPDAPIPTPK